MPTPFGPGDAVVIDWKDNPRVDGTAATVELAAAWGAHLAAPAAATGRLRALWSELRPAPAATDRREPAGAPPAVDDTAANMKLAAEIARSKGYTGDACGTCGSQCVVRNGACTLCRDCGSTSGCS